jgi:dGTPase
MGERAGYASDPNASRGRVFATSESPTRSVFQRDRDRIVHSTAFRRLQHKTQVFLHHEGRHFRNRLTHTLEVSQMARSIARALRLDEDLAEAIALSHDLGHTPFGHAGERVLDQRMAELGGFDHNVQALRVVTRIENRYAEHDGLNLTRETLDGILKHNGPMTDRDGTPVGGYAVSGLPGGLREIANSHGIDLFGQPSLEAQAAAIADDIAYNAHDIDDALRAGLLTLSDLGGVPIVGPIVAEVVASYPEIGAKRQAHEVQRRLITRTIEDVITHSLTRLTALGVETLADVGMADGPVIAFSRDVGEGVLSLKAFLFENVYRHESVMVPVRESQVVVGRLFDAYIGGSAMPGRWGEAFRMADDTSSRARLVCDFIAGMTDPYALDEHRRLFDARPDFG